MYVKLLSAKEKLFFCFDSFQDEQTPTTCKIKPVTASENTQMDSKYCLLFEKIAGNVTNMHATRSGEASPIFSHATANFE